jgi:hypothetical protein
MSNEKRDEMVERGAIIADSEGTLFRVLLVDDEGIFMQKIKPKPKHVTYTRTVTWEQYRKFSYDLKFP